MKLYISRFLKSVAFFYISFPLSYLVIAALLFDVPAANCMSVLLSPGYLLVSLLSVLTGYALWEMRRWGWYLFVADGFLIAYLNAVVVTDYGESHHKVVAFFVSVLVQLAVAYRVGREIRVPYFFPKIRWWESNPRYRLSVPVKLARMGSEIDGQILDLSMGGCFVKVRNDVALDELLSVSFEIFTFKVECQGTVVWRTQSTVTHPKGVGIKFRPHTKPQKRALKQVTLRLRKIAALYRRSRYLMSQEEFLKQLQELESGSKKSVSTVGPRT